ncbi:universal stress protein [Massilia sp. LXY-6]|uniref:universal stress protein n=1 Tax=Massilia sp. LXY-6 TaxID=3379823 RepID=UPI003EDFDDF7
MYKRILVPTDGTELCSAALATALELATLGGGSIVGFHAGPPDRLGPLAEEDAVRAAWLAEREQAGTDALSWIARRASEAGVPCETLMIHHESPAAAIVETARDRHCDLIVMASHGHAGLGANLRARLLGSETWKVLSLCAIPVLVVRGPSNAP